MATGLEAPLMDPWHQTESELSSVFLTGSNVNRITYGSIQFLWWTLSHSLSALIKDPLVFSPSATAYFNDPIYQQNQRSQNLSLQLSNHA